jgi:hypothetical protein
MGQEKEKEEEKKKSCCRLINFQGSWIFFLKKIKHNQTFYKSKKKIKQVIFYYFKCII